MWIDLVLLRYFLHPFYLENNKNQASAVTHESMTVKPLRRFREVTHLCSREVTHLLGNQELN